MQRGDSMPDIFIPENRPVNDTHDENAHLKLTKENHIHALSSFCQNPVGISFQNQEEDEEVLLFLRRHFITNIPWIFISLVLSLVPPLLFILNIKIPILFFSVPENFLIVFIVFYYLVVFIYAFISFITWYYNISLVTQKRVVDIDFSDIVYHDVAMTKLNLIEDVNYTQTGFIRSFFNYGDVFVQTAGEKLHFDFLAVPNPANAVNITENLIGGRK